MGHRGCVNDQMDHGTTGYTLVNSKMTFALTAPSARMVKAGFRIPEVECHQKHRETNTWFSDLWRLDLMAKSTIGDTF